MNSSWWYSTGRWICNAIRGTLATAATMLAGAALTAGPDHGLLLAAQDGESAAGQERQAVGLLYARCAVCHSTDLVTQQRLAREQWTAIVTKMAHWGAQVSDSEQQVLVDYLATRYHPDAGADPKTESSQRAAYGARERLSSAVYPMGNTQRGEALFMANCLACHGPRAGGLIGPRLAMNPILLEHERFWDTVLHGRGAMPPWREALTPQEIADIHAWLNTLQ